MNTSHILASGLLALLAAAIAGLIFLRRRQRERIKGRARFIQAYRFPMTLRNRLQRELEIAPERVDVVLEGLRQFFLACLSAQRSSIAREIGMPSMAVDAAWHEFITLTYEYGRFCEQAFGKYLHHAPEEAMQGRLPAALANTLHQFRQPALGPAGWAMAGSMPLIFAIDRELGIQGGHYYDDAAYRNLEKARQRQLASGGGDASGGVYAGSDGAGASCDAGAGGGGCCGGGGSCGGGGCGGS